MERRIAMTTTGTARMLMCAPAHFTVSYAINPWMDPAAWERDLHAHAAAARQQWTALTRALIAHGAAIELVPPAPGVPDLVFTANAAVVLDRTALLARFRHGERKREEPHFAAAFEALKARGVIDAVRRLPDGVVLEGAGDCVFDAARNAFWMGYGPRSDLAARRAVEATFGVEAIALELADARFYHVDTALCPLPRGEVMYFPAAFTAAGQTAIRNRVAADARIEIGSADAVRLAANAVALGDTLVMPACGERLRSELAARGYKIVTRPLDAFRKSGGAAFCLTLRLDGASAPAGAAAAVSVPAAA
jgi:N-dimethylarginine dimethylaminohydrolase